MSIVHPCGITYSVEFFWDNTFWYDESTLVRSCSIQTAARARGGSGVFDPGRMSVTLGNRDRKFDPLHASGTYYGELKPGRLTRVRFDTPSTSLTGAWWGYVDRFSFAYDKSCKDSTATVTCVDDLALASFASVPAGNTPGLTAGENAFDRMAQIGAVNAYGPDFTDAGGVNFVARFSGQDRWDASRDHSVVDELRRAVDLERGVALPTTSGSIAIFDRHWFKRLATSTSSQATFGVGGLPVFGLNRVDDADELITAAAMTDELGNAVVAIDASAEQDYKTRYPSASFTSMPSLNDEDLDGAVNTMVALGAVEISRIDSLVVKPAASSAVAAAVATLQPLSRITVTWTPTGVGSAVSADYFIDGISHDISPSDWTTTYSLWPCAPFDAAIPGDLFIVGSSLVGGADLVGL